MHSINVTIHDILIDEVSNFENYLEKNLCVVVLAIEVIIIYYMNVEDFFNMFIAVFDNIRENRVVQLCISGIGV